MLMKSDNHLKRLFLVNPLLHTAMKINMFSYIQIFYLSAQQYPIFNHSKFEMIFNTIQWQKRVISSTF